MNSYNATQGVTPVFSGLEMFGGNLFAWITLTMMWVLMILAITALFKYVTSDDRPRSKSRASRQ